MVMNIWNQILKQFILIDKRRPNVIGEFVLDKFHKI